MDQQRDNSRDRRYSYSDYEQQRREHAARDRQAQRERYEQRQRSRYQTRRPSQGTWYERSSQQYASRPARQRPERSQYADTEQARQQDRLQREENQRRRREQQARSSSAARRPMQQAHRSVPLQHQSFSDDDYAQPQPQRAPRPQQVGAGYNSAYAGPELTSRDILIRVAIVAVLLVIFIARIATFGGCAESSSLDTQINDQQAQLQQINDSNTQAQSQIQAMQSTIDSYDKLSSSSSSSSSSSN